MPAYVIAETEVRDETLIASYRELADASITAFGGRFLTRGRVPEALEGAWPAERMFILVEFPTISTAREWYASAQYAEALKIRERALDRVLLLVDGGTAGLDT